MAKLRFKVHANANPENIARRLNGLVIGMKPSEVRPGEAVWLRPGLQLDQRRGALRFVGRFVDEAAKAGTKAATSKPRPQAKKRVNGPAVRPSAVMQAVVEGGRRGGVKVTPLRGRPSQREPDPLTAELRALVRVPRWESKQPVGLAAPGGEAQLVYWVGLRRYGCAGLVAPFVLEAGYSQERADEVVHELSEGQLYPFFDCERFREMLEALKPHIQACRKTLFQPNMRAVAPQAA